MRIHWHRLMFLLRRLCRLLGLQSLSSSFLEEGQFAIPRLKNHATCGGTLIRLQSPRGYHIMMRCSLWWRAGWGRHNAPCGSICGLCPCRQHSGDTDLLYT